MKEATGELNMTVITVVAVVAVGAFFTIFVLPGLQTSIRASQICNNKPGITIGVAADEGYVSCGKVQNDGSYTCAYNEKQNDGTLKATSITCSTTSS